MLVVIPARAGSKRIPQKALRRLGAHPLLAYTIASARAARAEVYVASEDETILACAAHYGAKAYERPRWTAMDDAPDISWLRGFVEDCTPLGIFMLRRLTSPFLTVDTITRAWEDFARDPGASSMRAVRASTEHPFKQWVRQGAYIAPRGRCEAPDGVEPWSMPTQALERTYVQTAGLEVLRPESIKRGSLTGNRVLPLLLEGAEALDLNTPHDWWVAEQLIDAGAATLPVVDLTPWVPHA